MNMARTSYFCHIYHSITLFYNLLPTMANKLCIFMYVYLNDLRRNFVLHCPYVASRHYCDRNLTQGHVIVT